MRTRRMIAGIMAVATMTAAMAGATATAATSQVGISVSTAEAKAGQPFTLTVDMKDIPDTGIAGVDFGIQFDDSLVTVTDVAKSTLTETGVDEAEGNLLAPFEYGIEDGLISVSWIVGSDNSNYYMKGSGEFLTITGTVNSDAAAGSKADFKIVPIDRPVTGSSAELNNSIYIGYIDGTTSVTYDYTLTDGYVTVLGDTTETTESSETTGSSQSTSDFGEASKYGDVNLDGNINLQDVILLCKYLAAPAEYPLSTQASANADVVKDNSLGNSDVVRLTKYVSGDTSEVLGSK